MLDAGRLGRFDQVGIASPSTPDAARSVPPKPWTADTTVATPVMARSRDLGLAHVPADEFHGRESPRSAGSVRECTRIASP